MKKILALFTSILIIAFNLSACGSVEDNIQSDSEKINVVATIFPQYDFVREIAGDRVNVSMLTKPGSSVHSYDPSPADIVSIQNSDLFICVGGESDAWVDRMLESVDTSDIIIVRLIDHVQTYDEEIKEGMEDNHDDHDEDDHDDHDEDDHDDHDGYHDSIDEHIWASIRNAEVFADVIKEALVAADAENADFYNERAEEYKSKLVDIDREITEIVDSSQRRKIVVADKFPFLYFVKDYGLDYEAAFPGCSDQADAGIKTMTHLIDAVNNEGIPYVYYVELSNKSVALAISEQTGAGMLLLHSCHNVSADEFKEGATYLSLMKQNAENLKKGLN